MGTGITTTGTSGSGSSSIGGRERSSPAPPHLQRRQRLPFKHLSPILHTYSPASCLTHQIGIVRTVDHLIEEAAAGESVGGDRQSGATRETDRRSVDDEVGCKVVGEQAPVRAIVPPSRQFEFTLSGCARQEIQARQTRGSKEDVHCSARSTAGTEHCRGEVGAEERFAGE